MSADFLPRLEALMGRATKDWQVKPSETKAHIANVYRLTSPTNDIGDLLQWDANLAAYLVNHAPAIAQLVRAAEYYATEYRIADEGGELGFWPVNEMLRCKAIAYALAALNAEEK